MEHIERADVIIHKRNGIILVSSGMKYKDRYGSDFLDVDGKTFIVIGAPDESGYYHVNN